MLVAPLFAALAIAPAISTEPWTLPSPNTKGAKLAWKVVAKVDVDGQSAEASYLHMITVNSVEEKLIKATLSWDELEVNGQQMGNVGEWPAVLNLDGSIQKMVSEDDAYRRMLTVFMPSFPTDKPIDVGSKWESNVQLDEKNARKLSQKYEVVGFENAGSVPTIRIKGGLKESGEGDMVSEGTWWIGKNGIVQKFTIKVTNWIVPLAGDTPITGVLEGTLKG